MRLPEVFVGSLPCHKGFYPGSPVFLPPQKSTFLNSNLILNRGPIGKQAFGFLCNILVKIWCFKKNIVIFNVFILGVNLKAW
jgi:hypothetical protein